MANSNLKFMGLDYSIVDWESDRPTSTTVDVAGVNRTNEGTYQRWRMQIEFAITRGDEAAAINAHREANRGLVPFKIIVPQPTGVILPHAGRITVNTVPVAGQTSMMANFLRVGDRIAAGTLFKFPNHSKIYQVSSTVERVGTDSMTKRIDFQPGFVGVADTTAGRQVSALTANAVLDYSPALEGKFIYDPTPRQSVTYDDPFISVIEVSLIEYLGSFTP